MHLVHHNNCLVFPPTHPRSFKKLVSVSSANWFNLINYDLHILQWEENRRANTIYWYLHPPLPPLLVPLSGKLRFIDRVGKNSKHILSFFLEEIVNKKFSFIVRSLLLDTNWYLLLLDKPLNIWTILQTFCFHPKKGNTVFCQQCIFSIFANIKHYLKLDCVIIARHLNKE